MAVRLELVLHVAGPGDTEDSLRESCAWLEQHMAHTAEYHDLVAQLAMMLARIEWREADRMRAFQRQADARQERAAARRAAREQP